MGIFDGYLLCSDIDGTLTYEAGKVSEKNLAAIKRFTEEGGKFSIASGRYADYAETVLGYKSVFPVIGLNGSVIYDRQSGATLWRKPLSRRTKEIALEAYENCGMEFHCISINNENSTAVCHNAEELKKALFEGSDEPFKVVFVTKTAEDCDRICSYVKEHYSGLVRVMKSCPVLTEILELGTGKSECMRMLKEMYPDVHTTVSAGDYENDMELVRDADIGYAVENALPCVKAVAKRFAPANTEDAIAYIIDELERDAVSGR